MSLADTEGSIQLRNSGYAVYHAALQIDREISPLTAEGSGPIANKALLLLTVLEAAYLELDIGRHDESHTAIVKSNTATNASHHILVSGGHPSGNLTLPLDDMILTGQAALLSSVGVPQDNSTATDVLPR